MATTDLTQPLWHIVAGLEQESIRTWHASYGGAEDLESALAGQVREVETIISRGPGGNVSVTVSVHSYRPAANMVSWFSLQRAGNKHYRRVEQVSS